MTEDEAKTKWCPFARHDTTAGNRIAYGKPGDEPAPEDYCAETAMRFPCIGSACMAWRWSNKTLGHSRSYQMSTHGSIEGTRRWEAFCREKPLRGFCGLAGAPQ